MSDQSQPLSSKQQTAVADAAATHGLGVPDHAGQFRMFCPEQSNGCGFITPVESASAVHTLPICPNCGRQLIVLSEDEQRSTPGVLEAIAKTEGAKGLKSTDTPTTVEDESKDDKKGKK